MAHSETASLVLPLSVTSPTDLGRLLRELGILDNYLMQFDLKGQTGSVKMHKTSLLLDSVIDANKLDLLQPEQRKRIIGFLQDTKANAPVLHISFGADPSPSFVEKLMTWLRREIHPQVLLTIGLQPNIGAGCLVRSTNRYFDFSLRENFTKNRELLMSKLREVNAS
jgi:hypothetical protein